MNIAVLSAANSVHTVKIVNSLSEMGHSVFLFSLPDHADRDGAVDKSVTLKYFRYPGRTGYLVSHIQLRKWLAEYKIDVLNAHYATGYGTVGALCGFHPYALSVWGSDVYDFPRSGLPQRLLLERNLKKADIILSTSHCMARKTSEYSGNRRIIVTPFGVDTSVFVPFDRANNKEVNIGFIKAVSEKYGIEYLLRAFKTVCDECHDKRLNLLIYGKGDQLEKMKELSRSLGISDRTSFFGYIPHENVPKALSSMDIFCVPSVLDSESFGVSAVEAMSCGVPCVTSDVDGLSEVMVDGETGFIVKRRDERALAEKIIWLVRNPELRKRLGENARKRVIEKYSWSDNIKVLESALRTVAEK